MTLFHRRPELLLVLVTLLWGSTFVVTADVVARTAPLPYIALRFGGAALVLVLLHPRVFSARVELRNDGLLLGLGQGLGLLLQVFGQVYTTAAKSAFVTALATVLMPLWAFAWHRERPARPAMIAVVLATAGLFLLTYPGRATQWNRGDLLTMGSAAVYTIVFVATARRARRHPTGELATVQTMSAAALFLVLLGLTRIALQLWPPTTPLPPMLVLEQRGLHLTPLLGAQLAYMILVCTVVTFLAQTWALARLHASHAAVLFALEPVFALILALLWRGAGEWPGSRGGAGAALVLAGVLYAELGRR